MGVRVVPTEWRERIGLEHPVVQAGMAAAAGPALAGAVSAAGGLGTVGIMAPQAFAASLRKARGLAPGRPVAGNLIVPFTRRAHVDACVSEGAALVVLHGGFAPRWVRRLRAGGVPVFQTVGTAAQARRALSEGATGLVVQGLEAGGHLVGVEPLERALPQVLDVAGGAPVLAAGGVAGAADVRRLLDAGASAAVAGTRFLLTEESGAHPAYRRRLVEADRTLVTELFGFGWPLRHRVVPNAATERWCAGPSDLGPEWVRRAAALTGPVGRLAPLGALGAAARLQRPALPLFSPALALAGMPEAAVDRTSLYAGETVRRLDDVVSAAEAVRLLTP